MATAHTLAAYNYRFKDPAIRLVDQAMKELKLKKSEIQNGGGPNASTINSWLHGDTIAPQNKTIEAALRAMGKKRVVVDMGNEDAKRKLPDFKATPNPNSRKKIKRWGKT